MSSKILLLGGCHHIGQHLLVPEIMGQDDCVVDGAQIVGKMGKKMVLWFLEQNKEKVTAEIGAMPFVVDTHGLKKRKQALENKLKDIEEAVKIFSRRKVYVEI